MLIFLFFVLVLSKGSPFSTEILIFYQNKWKVFHFQPYFSKTRQDFFVT